MFYNIGKVIKITAIALLWFGTVAALAAGIYIMASVKNGVGKGFLVMLGGFAVSFLSFLLFYGFGELVENSAMIAGKREADVDPSGKEWDDEKFFSGLTAEAKKDLKADPENADGDAVQIDRKPVAAPYEKTRDTVRPSKKKERPQFVIGECQICGKKDVPVAECKITDEYGTRYRNKCVDCIGFDLQIPED